MIDTLPQQPAASEFSRIEVDNNMCCPTETIESRSVKKQMSSPKKQQRHAVPAFPLQKPISIEKWCETHVDASIAHLKAFDDVSASHLALLSKNMAEIRVLEYQMSMKKNAARQLLKNFDIPNAVRFLAEAERLLRFIRAFKLILANEITKFSARAAAILGSESYADKKRSPEESDSSDEESCMIDEPKKRRRVMFNAEPEILGHADGDYSRESITATQPSLLEDILLRIFGNHPDESEMPVQIQRFLFDLSNLPEPALCAEENEI